MGAPAKKLRATYADLETVPRNMVGEIIDGVLHVLPRPAPPHAHAAFELGYELGGPFGRGRGGPGGWVFLPEPELRIGPPPPGHDESVIPDLAGWRKERMPRLPTTAHVARAPDWVCEVLSRSTEAHDRAEKMPCYARAGVPFLWLVHPILRTLEVYVLDTDRRWKLSGVHRRDARVSAEPFEAVPFELGALWVAQEGESEETEGTPESTEAPAATAGRTGRPKRGGGPTKGRQRR